MMMKIMSPSASVEIPANVVRIKDATYENQQITSQPLIDCKNILENVEFEANSNLSDLGFATFCGFSKLNQVDLRNCKKLKTISVGCFSESSLRSIFLPEDGVLEKILTRSFYNTKIQSIIIPNSVKVIAGYYEHQFYGGPFLSCANLQEIIIHDESNLTRIGYAFAIQSGITSFFIPKNLVMQEGAFVRTIKLKSITLHPNNINYSLYKGILYSKDYDKLILCPNALENKVEFHPSCTYIGTEGFRGYSSIYDLVIPETILTFSGRTFFNCYAKKIVFEGSRLSFDVVGWFYESASEIVFPDNLKIIKSKCFENSHVRKIEMNSKIEIIETDAFFNCIYLEEFKINHIDQILVLQSRAFNGCPKLVSFVLPAESASLIKFNNSAVVNCARYLEITYIMNLATISDHFLNTSSLNKSKIDIRSIDNKPCESVGFSFKSGECKLNHVCSLENYNSFSIHLFLSLMNINNIHPNIGSLFP